MQKGRPGDSRLSDPLRIRELSCGFVKEVLELDCTFDAKGIDKTTVETNECSSGLLLVSYKPTNGTARTANHSRTWEK